MAHYGTAVIIDRIVKLLQQELAVELPLVDAAANGRAVANDAEHVFTTEVPQAAAVRGYFDEVLGNDTSVVVLEADAGRSYGDKLRQDANEGAPTNRPRIGTEHGIVIRFRCTARRGSWTATGAYRRCDRLAMAGVVILGRFPRLSVPAPASLAPLVGMALSIHSDRRASAVQQDDRLLVSRDVGIVVPTLEDRS